MASSSPSRSSFAPFQRLLYVIASIICLPASLIALFYNFGALVLCPQYNLRHHVHKSVRFKARKIVITGISTPAGIRAARALYHTGHNVVGVEEGGYAVLQPARWSRAVSRLRSLPPPTGPDGDVDYAESLFHLVVRERASLWIDCSNGHFSFAKAKAKDMIEERSTCVCFVPNLEQIRRMETRHGFQKLAQKLGLPSLQSHSVQSRSDIYNVLNEADGKKYLLSSPNGTSEPATRTILPRRTVSQTYQDVAQLKLSKSSPWTLEEYMEGLQQFTASGIVVRGRLRAFVACSLSDPGQCKAISAKSGLSDAMKQYMESFAGAIGPGLTSHLTMKFCLDEKATHSGVVQQIQPLGGHLVPHESLLLFDGRRGSMDLTRAYMDTLSASENELEVYTGLPYSDAPADIIMPAEAESGVYAVLDDVRRLVLDPLLLLLTFRSSISSAMRSWVMFVQHLVSWQEALYEFSDPLPLFWYAHVSAPCYLFLGVVATFWAWLSTRSRKSVRARLNGSQLQNGR